ncbi:carboxylate--amine ligase [Duganella sp. FT94W]|uniref:Carboxylate--amine ligase n=1 Tax=Duganella lactea TaxID=2692173 RepID=A0ABW9V8M5_9BURK|nr:carboxylate--amine ligase [Duganella lactea]MYM35049.1 carboxylate--amine ligase [Duganella lactea]
MPDNLLPAVVLGIDTPIGLAIIRDLGRRGVPVYGIARSAEALGLRSRYLKRGLLRAGDGTAGVVAQLRQLYEEIGEACLFAISETDINALNAERAHLQGYRLLFASAEAMAMVLDKTATYAVAERVGIHVPRTLQPASLEHATAEVGKLRYPVVLKWADPNGVAPPLRQAGLLLDKVHYCADAAALLAYLRPYQAAGLYPLVQEYCAGYGLGQFILMRDGQPHYLFQHRRLHEWPPEGGVSTVCQSLPLSQHMEQMRRSVALLRALRWEGVAMVEYRHDPVTGQSALMEVNGRFWGSLPLACHAGAAFPWLLYQLHGLHRPVWQTPYRAGLRCRFMLPETRRLLRVLGRRGGAAEFASYLIDFARPGTRYYVHDWRDPGPLWADVTQMLWRALHNLPGMRRHRIDF